MSDHNLEINFEVCQNCAKHSWCTHHDEKKYHSLFLEIKTAIEAHSPHVVCVKNKSTPNPSIGAFEITHKDIIIFSKKSTGLFPQAAPTAQRVASFLDDLKSGKDVTKYASMVEKKYEAPRKQKERPTFESYKKLKEEEDQHKSQQVQQKEQKQQKQQQHTEEDQQQEQQEEDHHQAHHEQAPQDHSPQKAQQQQPVPEQHQKSIQVVDHHEQAPVHHAPVEQTQHQQSEVPEQSAHAKANEHHEEVKPEEKPAQE